MSSIRLMYTSCMSGRLLFETTLMQQSETRPAVERGGFQPCRKRSMSSALRPATGRPFSFKRSFKSLTFIDFSSSIEGTPLPAVRPARPKSEESASSKDRHQTVPQRRYACSQPRSSSHNLAAFALLACMTTIATSFTKSCRACLTVHLQLT